MKLAARTLVLVGMLWTGSQAAGQDLTVTEPTLTCYADSTNGPYHKTKLTGLDARARLLGVSPAVASGQEINFSLGLAHFLVLDRCQESLIRTVAALRDCTAIGDDRTEKAGCTFVIDAGIGQSGELICEFTL